jgi:hypothetical protein
MSMKKDVANFQPHFRFHLGRHLVKSYEPNEWFCVSVLSRTNAHAALPLSPNAAAAREALKR